MIHYNRKHNAYCRAVNDETFQTIEHNPQLEDHRQLVPLPEDLMRKLGGGYSFTKVDLADAYNQIC